MNVPIDDVSQPPEQLWKNVGRSFCPERLDDRQKVWNFRADVDDFSQRDNGVVLVGPILKILLLPLAFFFLNLFFTKNFEQNFAGQTF